MSDRTFRTASKDLAGRCCRYCLKGIKKGDRYRVGGYTARRRVIYEHLWCVGRHREEPQAGPPEKRLVRAFKRPSCTITDAHGGKHTGTGANFPGLVAEWEWTDPKHPPYRVHIGALAWARHRMTELTSAEVNGAASMLVSRVAQGRIDSDRLWQECREAEDEFELSPGSLVYFLAAIGVATLQGERVKEEEVMRLNTVTESFIAHVLEGEADET